MRERVGQRDSQLAAGEIGERAAPLQPVGAIGGTLHDRLEPIAVDGQHVRVGLGRLRVGTAESLHQRVASSLRQPLGDLFVRRISTGHAIPSSRCALNSARNDEA